MATNEKITLNVDLYDNIMTEQKGDYTGRARITAKSGIHPTEKPYF